MFKISFLICCISIAFSANEDIPRMLSDEVTAILDKVVTDENFNYYDEQELTILLLSGNAFMLDNSRQMETFNPNDPSENRLMNVTIPYESNHIAGLLYNTTIIVAGGGGWLFSYYAETTSHVHLFNIKTHQVHPAPSMNIERSAAAGAIIDDVFYVCGGSGKKPRNQSPSILFNQLRSCERFVSDRWELIAPMNQSRMLPAIVAYDGYLYVFGGYSGIHGVGGGYSSYYLNTTERYDPISNAWQFMASKDVADGATAAVVYNDSIYVCGGEMTGWKHQTLDTCHKYSPTMDEWKKVASMNLKRKYFSLVVFNDVLYAIGGFDKKATNLVEWYDSEADQWHIFNQALIKPQLYTSAFVIKQELFII